MTDLSALLLAPTPEPAPTKVPRRPYTRIRGKRERSVTEIIERKKIDGLSWAAAKLTAEHAVYERDAWSDMNDEQAVDYLRRHFQGVWDGRAALGTAVHEVMDGWDTTGGPVDVYEVVCRLAETEHKPWRGHEDEVLELLRPYIEGALQWWEDWEPEGGATEECVRTPGLYLGQRDRWRFTVKGHRNELCGADVKTTAQSEPAKGVYVDSWTLQLVGYDRAAEIVDYGLDPNGRVIERGTRPNERADVLTILHLRGLVHDNGRMYHFFRVPTCDADYRAFCDLARFNTWALGIDDMELQEVEA